MEAFIVPQIQPQAIESPKAHSAEKATNESSFAPTLNKAIKEQNNSESKGFDKDFTAHQNTPDNQESPETHSQNISDSQGSIETHISSTLDNQISTETLIQGQIKFNENDLESTYAMHREILFADLQETTPYTENIKYDGKNHLSPTVKPDTNQSVTQQQSNANQLFQSPLQARDSRIDFVFNPNNVQPAKSNIHANPINGSHAFTPEFAKLDNGLKANNIALQNSSSSIIRSATPELNNHQIQVLGDGKNIVSIQQLKPEAFIVAPDQLSVLQNGDTLTISQAKKVVPHQILQNSGSHVLNLSLGDAKPLAPSLTTEKILSELTQPQVNAGTNNWRTEQPSLRQDIASQFLDKAIGRESIVVEKNFSQQQFENEGETQNGSQSNSFAKSSETAGENQLGQSNVNQTQDKPGFSLTNTLRPGTPGIPLPLSDDNIINQVLSRIRHSQALQDSKLVLKLHPVELGELKIDVQIKEGSLHASMVAQNQQVQEILEKNLPRLREMLEQQGLRVDDIVVSLDSDLGEDFNTFNDHLAQDNDHASSRKNKPTREIFIVEEDSTDTENETIDDADSMVNVKV